MAFKPIMVEEIIDGITYKAQFNGVSALYRARTEFGDDDLKAIEYQLKHVLIEPAITDIDDYFGTNIEHMNKVVTFLGKVMSANSDYFPNTDIQKAKATGK